jgi:hypothetical protein
MSLSLASTVLTFSSIFVTKCLEVNDNATIIDYTFAYVYVFELVSLCWH